MNAYFMLGKLPLGVRDGHISHRPRSRDEFEHALLWNRLTQRYRLPNKEDIFLYELQQLDHGRRWAPNIDIRIWNSAVAMCKKVHVTLDQRQGALKTSHILDARLQFEKLSWHLSNSGLNPLIKVRRGTHHTLVYIVYCCMIADPGNFTIWKIGNVGIDQQHLRATREQLANFPYAYRMMIWKALMTGTLEQLGLRFGYETNYNKIYRLICASLKLNKMQFLSERYPDSNRDHLRLIEADRNNMQIRLRVLRELAFLVARQDNAGRLEDEIFNQNFDGASWFALCFDPLYPGYVKQDFNDVTDAPFYWGHYAQFQNELRLLMATHEEELENAWNASSDVRPRRMRRMMSDSDSDSSSSGDSNQNGPGNLSLM